MKGFARQFLLPRQFGSEDYLAFSFLHVITLVEMLRPISFLVILFQIPASLPFFILALFWNSALALSCNFINRRGKTKLASYIFIILFQLQLYVFAWLETGVYSPAMLSAVVATVWAAELFAPPTAIFLTLVSIVVGYSFAFFSSDISLSTVVSFQHGPVSFWTITVYNMISLLLSQIIIIALLRKTIARENNIRKQLQQADRMKNDFLINISHELRTPLTSITGWTELLMHEHLDPETQKQALATIERNANHQSKLIEDLVDLSQLTQGQVFLHWSAVNVNKVLQEAVAITSRVAEEAGIKVHMEKSQQSAYVWCDAERLTQILISLLSNAIKFSNQQGSVTVRATETLEHVVIDVVDKGIGVPEELQPYIFERFFQADPSRSRRYGGLGIGLSIAKDFVELMHGSIELHSGGAGDGSRFTLRFRRLLAPAS